MIGTGPIDIAFWHKGLAQVTWNISLDYRNIAVSHASTRTRLADGILKNQSGLSLNEDRGTKEEVLRALSSQVNTSGTAIEALITSLREKNFEAINQHVHAPDKPSGTSGLVPGPGPDSTPGGATPDESINQSPDSRGVVPSFDIFSMPLEMTPTRDCTERFVSSYLARPLRSRTDVKPRSIKQLKEVTHHQVPKRL
ncbi:hypothetical protein BGZ65_003327 [Modicella reniformis]|uniref:Uncharacterized protein n=1 Tax=Modicella reniformis TaxID=1440133 RepID=A0A9P6IMS2_9FUNG|nr:hypothetical protein BGZ65_003327 [Modicella reniformis]